MKSAAEKSKIGGLAGWLMQRWQGRARPRPSLALLEKISLAPRQSLALIEVDDRRFLVATSAEGAPAFCALQTGAVHEHRERNPAVGRARISW
jgi:flagellar biogenesis protein FliO